MVPGQESPQVRCGPGEAIAVNEGEEALLELASSDRRADLAVLQDGPDDGNASPSRVAGEEGGRGEGIRETADLGLVHGAFHLMTREHGGQVEERPRHGRYRNATDLGHLVGQEGPPVRLHAPMGSHLPGSGDFDPGARRGAQTPECGRAAMAQGCAGPGDKDSGHPSAVTRQGLMWGGSGFRAHPGRVERPGSVADGARAYAAAV